MTTYPPHVPPDPCKECGRFRTHKLDCGQREPNPFMALSAAAVDVLDDMVDEWLDRDRHGELNGGYGYGQRKARALDKLAEQIKEALRAKIRDADPKDFE